MCITTPSKYPTSVIREWPATRGLKTDATLSDHARCAGKAAAMAGWSTPAPRRIPRERAGRKRTVHIPTSVEPHGHRPCRPPHPLSKHAVKGSERIKYKCVEKSRRPKWGGERKGIKAGHRTEGGRNTISIRAEHNIRSGGAQCTTNSGRGGAQLLPQRNTSPHRAEHKRLEHMK